MKNLITVLALLLIYSCGGGGEDDDPIAPIVDNEIKFFIDGELKYAQEDNFFNRIKKYKDNTGLEYFAMSIFSDHVDEPLYNLNVSVNLSGVNNQVSIVSPQNGGSSVFIYSDENKPCTGTYNYINKDSTTISITTTDDKASGYMEFSLPFCFMYNQRTDYRLEFTNLSVSYD